MMSTVGGNGREYYVKYHPQLAKAFGNGNAALIIDRLEYWLAKKPDGFYKFFEPCQHPLYREGDSWLEELGLSRRSFLHAFLSIGVRYNSFTAFHEVQDKFQGKLYASYYARQTHQSFFVRNHQVVDEFLSTVHGELPRVEQPVDTTSPIASSDQQGKSLKSPKDKVFIGHRTQLSFPPAESAVPTVHNCRSHRQKVSFPPSIIAVPTGNNCRSYNKAYSKQTTKHNSSSRKQRENNSKLANLAEGSKLGEEMKKIWIEEIGEISKAQNKPDLLLQLEKALKASFNRNISHWRFYCRIIASSKFLMGETNSKVFRKAWITWVIHPEVVERIRSGEFTLGDRDTKLDQQLTQCRESIQHLKHELSCLESSLAGLKSDIEKQHRDELSQRLLELDEQKRHQLKQEFEDATKQRKDAIGTEFLDKGWQGQFIETVYDIFLREKLSRQIFGQSFEYNVALALEGHQRFQYLKQEKAEIEAKIVQEQSVLQQLIDEREATIAFAPGGFDAEAP